MGRIKWWYGWEGHRMVWSDCWGMVSPEVTPRRSCFILLGNIKSTTDIRGRAIRSKSGGSWFESTLFVTSEKSLNSSILQFLHQNKWSIQSSPCHAGCYLWKQFTASDTGQGGWGMLRHTQNKLKGAVPFSFHLNSKRKAIAEGLGLASVQDERWVPVILAESSPVPPFPKAPLEQQFILCRLSKTRLAESCRAARTVRNTGFDPQPSWGPGVSSSWTFCI